MAKRYDRYQLKPGDDLGDPSVLNTRFEDIDNRVHAQELIGKEIDEKTSELERVALSRLDNVFTGVLRDAQEKLANTGAWFKAESATALIPAIGAKQFTLSAATRGGFVATPHLLIVSASDKTHFMVATLESYVAIDGLLSVTVSEAFGETEKADWLIWPVAPGYAAHLADRDNPHAVTAAQVGAYSVAEADAAIDAMRAAIEAGAAEGLDTLAELAAALDNDENFAATISALIATKAPLASPALTGSPTVNSLPFYNWNWIINGDFSINQRGALTKAQSVGVYGYDRWKGHASGLEQIIEALPAGEYTLTWGGGGNGTFGGTTAASPIKATVAGGNASVVVPSTATKVSLVRGDHTQADPFFARHVSHELALCQRYYERSDGEIHWSTLTGDTNVAYLFNPIINFAVTKRSIPAIAISNLTTGASIQIIRIGTTHFDFRNETTSTGGSPDKYLQWSADAEL